ncbi:MAG: Ppx/GppA family phosphatase, partial [Sphingomonadaceae bacterium]|nr:Ppx/GppA family phosphatase [Sphingomonadaceae bacterium]
KGSLKRAVAKALASAPWARDCAGRPLYLVGGSWRALANVDMHRTGFPLPIVHHYTMGPERAARLVRLLARIGPARLAAIESLSSSRIANLPDGAALLSLLVRQIGPGALVASAYGLREGLLYERLDPATRARDPLIEATREEGEAQGRFAEHGDLLDRWIAPLFRDEDPESTRLRHAACLLGDVAWRAHPDFRAERGLDMALHGNWVNVDAAGRARIGQALFTSFGGGSVVIESLTRLCARERLEQATRWGLAMRLGQRLSGGVASPLEASRLEVDDEFVTLCLDPSDEALFGETVAKRLRQLAEAMGRQGEMLVRE